MERELEPVRLRPSLRDHGVSRLWALWALTALFRGWTQHPRPPGILVVTSIVALVILTDAVATTLRAAVVLTPGSVTVRRLRSRVIRWESVAGLTGMEPGGRWRARYLSLRLLDGSRVRLPVPGSGRTSNPRFDDSAAAVNAFAHRYAPRRPLPGTRAVVPTQWRVLRSGTLQRLVPAPAAGLAAQAVCRLGPFGPHELRAGALTFLAGVVAFVVLGGTHAVTLSPFGVSRGRNRVVPWWAVRAVDEEVVRCGRRAVLVLVDGTRVRLPAPRDGRLLRDGGYDGKLTVLREWVTAYGANAGGMPDVGGTPDVDTTPGAGTTPAVGATPDARD